MAGACLAEGGGAVQPRYLYEDALVCYLLITCLSIVQSEVFCHRPASDGPSREVISHKIPSCGPFNDKKR